MPEPAARSRCEGAEGANRIVEPSAGPEQPASASGRAGVVAGNSVAGGGDPGPALTAPGSPPPATAEGKTAWDVTCPFRRVLEVGRDPLIAAAWPERTVFRATGTPLRPGPAPTTPSVSWARVGWGLLRREFDALVLPAIHVDWQHDAGAAKRGARQALGGAARSEVVPRWIARLAGLSRRPIAVLDGVDHPRVSADTLRLYPPHARHFKVNLTPADAAAFGTRVRPLPMALAPAAYAAFGDQPKRHDVFYAAALVSPERRAALAQVEALRAAGIRVDVATERLPFADYLTRMSQARLTLSPAGHGHQCWRHFEALMVGSVPLISRPPEPRCEWLEHGRDAWFYAADASDLVSVVQDTLTAPERLSAMAETGRRHVLTTHTIPAVAARVLASLQE